MSQYHRAEYEDVAGILKVCYDSARSQMLTGQDSCKLYESAFIRLFESKGQSFDKTRFLNAVGITQRSD